MGAKGKIEQEQKYDAYRFAGCGFAIPDARHFIVSYVLLNRMI
jgi:hypothetical protein